MLEELVVVAGLGGEVVLAVLEVLLLHLVQALVALPPATAFQARSSLYPPPHFSQSSTSFLFILKCVRK